MCLIRSDAELRFKNLIHYPEIEIPRGSFTMITGKSGCGKSTYLKMLNRTVLPARGSILYEGRSVDEYRVLPYRREVLLVPQDIFLTEGTVRDNFDFYTDARGTPRLSDGEILQFLKICCSDFSPADLCTKMSGGERQRIFLAIFMSFAEKVLLLDEPEASLDEKTAGELMENIRSYCRKKGITVVCISHSSITAERFADHRIRLGAAENG